jgi:hypothetical protein
VRRIEEVEGARVAAVGGLLKNADEGRDADAASDHDDMRAAGWQNESAMWPVDGRAAAGPDRGEGVDAIACLVNDQAQFRQHLRRRGD